MLTFTARDPFGCRGVSCVKLPAAVAFPTDGRLLQRIEELRRSLPANNMKPLWKIRQHERAAAQLADATPGDARTHAEMPLAETIRVAASAEKCSARPQRDCIEEVTLDAEPRLASADQLPRVVPLPRANGPSARPRERLFSWGSAAPVTT
jgi:hypothetical protein